MNINNFIITKVKDITLYKKQCSNCGWENSLAAMTHYCHKCGKDLTSMRLKGCDSYGINKNLRCQ